MAAAGRNQWWRYLLSLVAIIVTYIAAGIVFFLLAAAVLASFAPDAPEDEGGAIDGFGGAIDRIAGAVAGIDNWADVDIVDALAAFVVLMLPFVAVLGATLLMVALIHKRPWRTLIHAGAKFRWRNFLASFAVAGGLALIDLLLGVFVLSGDIELVFDGERFLPFLPFVLSLVPLQVLAEELVFRGYLLQLVALLARSSAVRALVPASLFVLAHMKNAEVDYAGIWALLLFAVLGLYLSILAIRGNGLEYALGFHLGINLFALTVISSTAQTVMSPTIFFDRAPDFVIGFVFLIVLCVVHYWIMFGRPGEGRPRAARRRFPPPGAASARPLRGRGLRPRWPGRRRTASMATSC